ncbi:class I SAM-dependent methyltransferase [Actinoplanes auranticolor]|uniref:class I SAM-dependent methyltransferase n=1 Tax=Actinoplanes auranticolor TaxID=47988 RepID=UPI001BB42744
MQLYPRLTAVAVDVQAELIRRARAEAEALGSADRVRFVVDDATVFSDPEPFDMVFWSQFYFPASSREDLGHRVTVAATGRHPGRAGPANVPRRVGGREFDQRPATARLGYPSPERRRDSSRAGGGGLRLGLRIRAASDGGHRPPSLTPAAIGPETSNALPVEG